MPARIVVCCRKPLAEHWLERAQVRSDFHTAAELAELDDDVAEAALDDLSVGDEITYAGATRPIQYAVYDEPPVVREMIEEIRERLAEDDPVGAVLGETQAIVDFELGFQQAEGIGGVIAEELARAIAFDHEGIVDFYGDEWRIVQDGVERVERS